MCKNLSQVTIFVILTCSDAWQPSFEPKIGISKSALCGFLRSGKKLAHWKQLLQCRSAPPCFFNTVPPCSCQIHFSRDGALSEPTHHSKGGDGGVEGCTGGCWSGSLKGGHAQYSDLALLTWLCLRATPPPPFFFPPRLLGKSPSCSKNPDHIQQPVG